VSRKEVGFMEEIKPKPGSSDSNLMAALSYIWIVSVIMLVLKKDDEFIKFHAKQATVLFILSVAAMILSPILFPIGLIVWLFVIVMCILGFIKALGGDRYKLWLIGDLAEKIKI